MVAHRRHGKFRAPPTERAYVLLPPDAKEGAMDSRFPVGLTANHIAALETQTYMRATIADVYKIIKQTRGVVEDTREAILRADAILRVTPRER